jgi:hypothetical protein
MFNRKQSLIVGMTALLAVSFVFFGCSGGDAAAGANGAPGTIYLSGPQKTAGINAALESGAPVVFAGAVQSDDGVITINRAVTFIGKEALTVLGDGGGSKDGVLVVVDANYIKGTGKIATANTDATIIAPQAVLDANIATGATGVLAPLVTETTAITEVPTDSVVALKGDWTITSTGTAANTIVDAGTDYSAKSLVVVGNLTVSAATSWTSINVLGNITDATAAITGPVSTSGNAKFTAAQSALTGLTVGGNLTAAAAVTVGTGNITVTGTATFDDNLTLSSTITADFAGGVTFKKTAATITSNSILFTFATNPATGTVFPAGTGIDSGAITLGAGTLTLGAAQLTLGTGAVLTGDVAVGSGANTVTLKKAALTAGSAGLVLAPAGTVTVLTLDKIDLATGGTITTAGTGSVVLKAAGDVVIGGTGGAGTWTATVTGAGASVQLLASATTQTIVAAGGGTLASFAGTDGTPLITSKGTTTSGLTIGKNTTLDLSVKGSVVLGNAATVILVASATSSDGLYADVGILKLSAIEIIRGNGSSQNAIGSAVTSTNAATKANTRADITTGTPDAANVAAASVTTSGVTTITAEDDATGNTFTSASKITSNTNA